MTDCIGFGVFLYFYFYGTIWDPKGVYILIGPKSLPLGPYAFVIAAQNIVNENRVIDSKWNKVNSIFILLWFLYPQHSFCTFPSRHLNDYLFTTWWSYTTTCFNDRSVYTNAHFLQFLQFCFLHLLQFLPMNYRSLFQEYRLSLDIHVCSIAHYSKIFVRFGPFGCAKRCWLAWWQQFQLQV